LAKKRGGLTKTAPNEKKGPATAKTLSCVQERRRRKGSLSSASRREADRKKKNSHPLRKKSPIPRWNLGNCAQRNLPIKKKRDTVTRSTRQLDRSPRGLIADQNPHSSRREKKKRKGEKKNYTPCRREKKKNSDPRDQPRQGVRGPRRLKKKNRRKERD